MKKIYFLLICLILFILNSTSLAGNDLIDVNNHWAHDNIIRMLTNGNINGYSDNTFRPDNEITTLEFIKMILNTLNIKIMEEGLNEWPDYYIATARKYNLDYDFYKKLTRYEAVDIISKLIDLKGVSSSNNKYKDLNSRYKNNVLKLTKLKIINGYEDNSFRGEKFLSRAEAVTIILRAADANRQIINNKNYKIDSKYTNFGIKSANTSEVDRIRYEIENNKIYFYDKGRFSNISGYSIDEKYITNKRLIDIIECLISEDTYTAVYYVPSKYVINQIIIKYGEDDNLVNRGGDYFSFTYYEDKLYDLQRISLKDDFTNECYLKIDINKMWKEAYDYKKHKFIDENIENKLYKALQIEFGKDAMSILEYMLTKYEENISDNYIDELVVEKVQLGKNIINFYKKDAMSLEFYFEKLSS